METIKKGFLGNYSLRPERGFTLIEILVVIGIIALLAAIVLVALNPARQFAQARQSQRSSNVNAILNAVGQYVADNQGALPDDIPSGDPEISEERGLIDENLGVFCDDIVPNYMPALPRDPSIEGGDVDDCSISWGNTGYEVIEDEDTGRISVCAPLGANEPSLGADATEICVTR